MASKSAFERLRPICMFLTRNPSRAGIETLRDVVKAEDKPELQVLQEYVLFPLRFIIKRGVAVSEELCTEAITCMTLILEKTEVVKAEMFQDIFNSLCLLISSPTEPGKLSEHSEELKHATVSCLQILLSHASIGVLQSMYSADFIPALGHAVSLLLNMASTESARHLKMAAMECIMGLGQCNRKVPMLLKVQIGNIFASFLPGTAMSLCKVITGDQKQGAGVVVCAILSWSKLVSLVMADRYLEKSGEMRAKCHQDMTKGAHKELQVQRTEDWMKSTAEKLALLVKKVGSVVCHDSWKVRLALAEWADSFLTGCSKSLGNCVSVFLETLVTFLGDEYANVATRSRQALTAFQKNCEAKEQVRPLVELLEENLLKMATSLPRIMRVSDDTEKLTALRLLMGYLQILGPKVSTMLHSYHHLKRLSLSLVLVLELACTDIKIIEEKTSISGDPNGGKMIEEEFGKHHSSFRKYFQHFHDEKIYQEVALVCRTLARFGDVHLLVDHFLDIYHESSSHRKEAALVLNELVLGVAEEDYESTHTDNKRPELEDLIRSLCEDYLSSANFNLPTSVQSETSGNSYASTDWPLRESDMRSHLSLAAVNSNILQICIQLEGIGNCSKVLQNEFNHLLMDVLYPVLEKLGSNIAIVSHTAHRTLCTVSSACGHSSISELLCRNSDYLVNAISLRLRHLERNPDTPLVLQVMLQYCDIEIMNYIEDTIEEILDSLDRHHAEEAAMFLRVLHSLSGAILRWYPPEEVQERCEMKPTDNVGIKKGNLTTEELGHFFLEYHKQKQIAEELMNCDDDEEEESHINQNEGQHLEEEEAYQSEDKKTESPRHVKLILKVLERCKHLVSSSNPRLRLLVLDIIANGCHILAGYKDDLLPMVHNLWPPFVQRLNDEEQLVIMKAFEVLCVMADVCKDFIRSRVSKEVLPKLADVLKKQAQVSVNAGSSYNFTLAFKMQKTLLHGMGKLCHQLSVAENDLDLVTSSCLPYLSVRQPRPLQEVAFESLRSLIQLDCDIIWLKLVDIYHKHPFIPPDPDFPAIKLCSDPGARNEFSDNIDRLMVLL